MPQTTKLNHLQRKRLVHQRVEECFRQAEDVLGMVFPRPEVSFNQRGPVAGTAIVPPAGAKLQKLRFNRIFLEDETEDFLRLIVPHEVAHLITASLYGRETDAHGEEWSGIMRDVFTLDPKPCHNYDVRRATGCHYAYGCACPGNIYHFPLRRHRELLLGDSSLRCKRCQELLVFLHASTYRSGEIQHSLSLPGMFLAVDRGYDDFESLDRRLKKILHGENPAQVHLLYPASSSAAVQTWIAHNRIKVIGDGGPA